MKYEKTLKDIRKRYDERNGIEPNTYWKKTKEVVDGLARFQQAYVLAEMTEEDMDRRLKESPIGTQIRGLVDKKKDQDVMVIKKKDLTKFLNGIGEDKYMETTEWYVDGKPFPNLAEELRKAYNGKSDKFTMRKGE